MKDAIAKELSRIAESNGVDILYAVESGSRAWGFESANSDFDVRFIYRDPPERVFRLYPERDVIEEGDICLNMAGQSLPGDFVGWSLQKMLRLACASNPQVMEWSASPIVYSCAEVFSDILATLRQHANPHALAYHYRSHAKSTWHKYLEPRNSAESRWHKHMEKREPPVGKKYLYAIRPLLACDWICRDPQPGRVPPVLFHDLRQEVRPYPHGATSEAIDTEIDRLLVWKMSHGEERGRARFPLIDQWIEAELERLADKTPDVPDIAMDPAIVEAIHARLYPDVFAVTPDDPGPEAGP